MEKKIKEYRVKDKYNKASKALFAFAKPDVKGGYSRFDHDSNLVQFFKNEQVLDLWFDVVYEEEYKVGDWITILSVTTYGWLNETQERTFKILKNPTAYCGGVYWTIGNLENKAYGALYTTDYRLATPEEIESVKTKVINIGFDVTIKNKRAFVGSDDITDFVVGLVEHYNHTINYGGFGYQLNDITFSRTGCKSVETKLSDWKKIYDEINQASKSHPHAYAC